MLKLAFVQIGLGAAKSSQSGTYAGYLQKQSVWISFDGKFKRGPFERNWPQVKVIVSVFVSPPAFILQL